MPERLLLDAAPSEGIVQPEIPPGFSIAHIGVQGPPNIRRSCTGTEEIIVCGRRNDSRYRLGPLLPSGIAPSDAGLPVGIDLAPGLRAGLEMIQHQRPDGFVAQEIWLRFRLRF